MKLLAIEREYGSGGREIGIKVAEKLEFHITTIKSC